MIERLSPVLAMKIILGLCALLGLAVGLPYALVLFVNSSGAVVRTNSDDQDRNSVVNSSIPIDADSGLGVTSTQAALLLGVAISLLLCVAFAFYLVPFLINAGRQDAEFESQSALRSLKEQVSKLEREVKTLRVKEEEYSVTSLASQKIVDNERRFRAEHKKLEDECTALRESKQLLAGQVDAYKHKERALELTQQRLTAERSKFEEMKATRDSELKIIEERIAKLNQEEKEKESDCRELQSQLYKLESDIEQRTTAKIRLEQEQNRLGQIVAELSSTLGVVEAFEKDKAQSEKDLADLKSEVELVNQTLREKQMLQQELLIKEESTKRLCEDLEKSANLKRLEAERQKQDAERQLRHAVEKENAIAEKERRLEEVEIQQQAAASELRQKALEAARDLTAAALERREAQSVLQEAALTLASSNARLKEVADFRSNNWPSWCIANSLSPTIGELEEWARAGNAHAKMVLSNLQVLNALEYHNELSKDFKYIGPTVRELGRFLAQSLALQGCSAEDTSRILVEWSKAINQSFAGKCRLSVPAIGSAFDPLEMQPVGGPVKTVARVHNWSIINSRAITEMKAEVS